MIRGQKRQLPKAKSTLNMNLNMNIHNKFDIEVIDTATGKVRQRAQAENVILDKLWTQLGREMWFTGIVYGSGTGTPSATDTSLFTYIDEGSNFSNGDAVVNNSSTFVCSKTFIK